MILRSLCFTFLALFLMLPFTGHSLAEQPDSAHLIQQLVGENYHYSIDFLFFSKLAEAELKFSKTETPGLYRAVLIGRTLGLASWLAGERTQTYISTMELTADGSLRTIEYSAEIVKRKWGKKVKKSRLLRFDYNKRTIVDEKAREDVVTSTKVSYIPDGQRPVDMLVAFYNLRAGIYGPLEQGTKLIIPTYAKGGFTDIEVFVMTAEQQKKQKYFPPDGLLLLAKVDPEIFETDNENIYVWLNDSDIPERGIVEDMIGLGDVKGHLEGAVL